MENSNEETVVDGLSKKKFAKDDGRIIIYYSPIDSEVD